MSGPAYPSAEWGEAVYIKTMEVWALIQARDE
jgi:hypothetical protein